jgi:6-pyruvoyltetrahydropterin/6-carboxytetrahydropterin synthase
MTLTRKYRFSASHRLHSPHLSDAENQAAYGKCNNPFGHGHNYELEVSVAGDVDPATGRVVDIALLDSFVTKEIVLRYNHRNLNEQIPELAHTPPTTEVVVAEMERRLREAWPESGLARLRRIRVWETRNNLFESEQH